MVSATANILLFLRLVTIVLTQAVNVFVASFVELPYKFGQWTFAVFGGGIAFLWTIASNRRLSLGIALLLILAFTIGRLGSENTGAILKFVDVVNECGVHPVYEVVNKFFLLPLRFLYQCFAAFYNILLQYLLDCGEKLVIELVEWWRVLLTKPFIDFVDFSSLLNSTNSGFWDLLLIPKILWEAFKCVLFFWTQPNLSRADPFFSDGGNPVYSGPFELYPTPSPSPIHLGYEFDPEYGAFRTQPSHVRDFFVDIWNIGACVGDTAFCTVSDLQDIRGKFFPSLLAGVDQPQSFWRRICDCIGRILSFLLFTWAYPYTDTLGACEYIEPASSQLSCIIVRDVSFCNTLGGTFVADESCDSAFGGTIEETGACNVDGVNCEHPRSKETCEAQNGNSGIYGGDRSTCAVAFPTLIVEERGIGVGFSRTRADVEGFVFKFARNVCCYLRWIYLVINDLLTTRDDGIPVIDIIQTAFNLALTPAERNINFFKRQHVFCRIASEISGAGDSCPLPDFNGCCEGLLAGNAGREVDGDACKKWDGVLTAQGTVPAGITIDYVDELKDCVKGTLFLFLDFIDASDVDAEASCAELPQDRQNTEGPKTIVIVVFDLICVFADFVLGVFYLLLTAVTDGCSSFIDVFLEIVISTIFDLIEKIIQVLFGRCCCPQRGPFLCFIEFMSQDVGGFFEVLCDVIDLAGEVLRCPSDERNNACDDDKRRKRDGGGAHRFTAMDDEAEFIRRFMDHRDDDELPADIESELRRMTWASDGRKMYNAFQDCYMDDNSTFAECQASGGDCAGLALECAKGHVNADNVWLTIDNPLPSWISGVYDDLGKQPNETTMFESARTSLLFAYDFSKKVQFWTDDMVPSYGRCMDEARAEDLAGKDHLDVVKAYIACLVGEDAVPKGHRAGDVWRTFLDQQDIDHAFSSCTRTLYDNGVLLDIVESGNTEGVSFTQAFHRGCAFLHAMGTRAHVASGGKKPVQPFLDMWAMPVELMRSASFLTSTKDEQGFGEVSSWAAKSVHKVVASRAFKSPYRAMYDMFSNASGHLDNDRVWQARRDVQIFWRVVDHYADLYDRVVVEPVSGSADEEAAERFDRLYHINERMKRDIVDHISTRQEDPSEPILAPLGASRIGAYWTLNSSDLFPQEAFPKNATLAQQSSEMTLELTFDQTERVPYLLFMGGRVTAPQLTSGHTAHNVRLAREVSSRALAPPPLRSEQQLAPYSRQMWRHYQPWRRFALPTVKNALREFQQIQRVKHETARRLHTKNGTASKYGGALHAGEMQDAMSALALINQMEHRDISESQRYALRLHGGAYDTLHAQKLVTTVFRMVNRRTRFASLPPAQALAMFWEGMNTRDYSSIARWIAGDLHYIIGTGFVDEQTYDYYMEAEQTERSSWMHVLSPMTRVSYRRLPFLGHAWLLRAKAKRQHRLALERKTAPVNERRIRAAHWTRRSRFLAQNGIDDEHVWAFGNNSATHQMWRNRTRLGFAAHNATVTQQIHGMTAGQNANMGVIGFADTVVGLLTLSDTPVSDVILGLENFWQTTILTFFQSPFDNLSDALMNFIESVECNVPEDFLLDGAGSYKLGCVPFLPERLLSFYNQFPNNQETGEIPWSDDLVQTECLSPPQPDDLCPNPQPFYWELTSDQFTIPCLYDACQHYAPPHEQRPFCDNDVVCDYCEREYHECADLGYTDGVIIVQTWVASLKAVWAEVFDNTNLLVPVFLAFTLLAFGDFLPVFGTGGAYFILFMVYGFNVFFGDLSTWVFTSVFLFVLWHILPLIAWIFWAVIMVRLAFFSIVGADPLPIILDLPFILDPQVLIRDALIFLRDSPFVFAVLNINVNSVFQPIIDRLDQFILLPGFAPTSGEIACSFLTIYNLVEFVLIGGVIGFATVYFAGLFFIFSTIFWSALRSFINAIWHFRVTLNIYRVSSIGDELSDDEIEQEGDRRDANTALHELDKKFERKAGDIEADIGRVRSEMEGTEEVAEAAAREEVTRILAPLEEGGTGEETIQLKRIARTRDKKNQ